MIRLANLLPEQIIIEISPAAQQAKKLGYTSAGFGRWKKGESGPVIARTKDGKLVPVKGAKGGAKKKARSDKPTKSQAKKAPKGKARATKKAVKREDTRSLKAVQQLYNKTKGSIVRALKRDGTYYADAEFRQVAMFAMTSPNTEAKKVVEHLAGSDTSPETKQLMLNYVNEVRKMPPLSGVQKIEACASFGDRDSRAAWKRMQKLQASGIKLKVVFDDNWKNNPNDTETYKKYNEHWDKTHGYTTLTESQTSRLSIKQGHAWRQQMTSMEIEELAHNQIKWKSWSLWSKPVVRKRIWSQLNTLTRKYGTPDLEVPVVYRGMSFSHAKAGSFLSNFEVGKTIVSPPSGYSTAPDVAEQFAYAYQYEGEHKVLINLKGARKKNVKGIHFQTNYMGPGNGKRARPGEHGGGSFEEQQEVAIPSTVGQKVVEMETVVTVQNHYMGEPVFAFVTHISLEQDSEPLTKKTIYEATKPRSQDEKNALRLFIKHMGGSVSGEKDGRRLRLLKKYMGGKVNQKRGSYDD